MLAGLCCVDGVSVGSWSSFPVGTGSKVGRLARRKGEAWKNEELLFVSLRQRIVMVKVKVKGV